MEKEASKQGVVLQEIRRDLDKVRSDAQIVEVAALEAALQAAVASQATQESQVAQGAAEVAAAVAEAIAGFDPATKLDKAGGVVTGSLLVNGQLSSDVGLKAGAAEYWSNGNIYGIVWVDWDVSGFAKQAIDARIEARATAIADEKINAAIAALKNNPEFTGTMKVIGNIQATGNIEGYYVGGPGFGD